MATSMIIEEETGTSTRASHAHNGYWAGSFGRPATNGQDVAADDTGKRQHAVPRWSREPARRLAMSS